jgi:hypothetical protein
MTGDKSKTTAHAGSFGLSTNIRPGPKCWPRNRAGRSGSLAASAPYPQLWRLWALPQRSRPYAFASDTSAAEATFSPATVDHTSPRIYIPAGQIVDIDDETKQFKTILCFGLLFLVSSFFAWKELKYVVWGKVVDADLISTRQVTTTTRRGEQVWLVVEYSFKESSGAERREKDRVSTDWSLPRGQTVPVQYLAGTDDSRLVGHRNFVAVIIFVVSFAVTAFFVGRLWLEGKRYAEEKRRSASYRR